MARSHRLLMLGRSPAELGHGTAWWQHDCRAAAGDAGSSLTSLPDIGPNRTAAVTGTAAPVLVRGTGGIRHRAAGSFTAASTQNLICDSAAAGASGDDLPVTLVHVAVTTAAGIAAVAQSLGRGSSSTPSHRLRLGSGDQPSGTRTDNAGTTKALNSAFAVTVGQPYAAALRCNGIAGDVWLNGRQILAGDLDVGTITLDRYSLGARRGASTTNYWTGLIGAGIVITRGVTGLEVQLLCRYLMRLYGVPG